MERQEQVRQRVPLRGYPKLSELMSLVPETMIFRRYNTVAMLNILRLQAELQVMERSLFDTIERDCGSSDPVIRDSWNDFYEMRLAKQKMLERQLEERSECADRQSSGPEQSQHGGEEEELPRLPDSKGIDLISDIGLKLQEYSESHRYQAAAIVPANPKQL